MEQVSDDGEDRIGEFYQQQQQQQQQQQLDSLQTVEFKVHNVTAQFYLGVNLDLDRLARNLWNVEYRNERITYRPPFHRGSKIRIDIFRDGKIICHNGVDIKDCIRWLRKSGRAIQRSIKDNTVTVTFDKFEVINIVGGAKLGYKLSMADVYETLISQDWQDLQLELAITFDPQAKNAVRVRIASPTPMTLVLLPMGSVRVSGAKREEQVVAVLSVFSELLR